MGTCYRHRDAGDPGCEGKGNTMGLMDKLRGEFVDIVEWLDDSRDTIVWRFPGTRTRSRWVPG